MLSNTDSAFIYIKLVYSDWYCEIAADFQITGHASAWLSLMGVGENVNDTKFILFQLVVLNFALKAHNDPLLKEKMGIK
jgi:hypothetical protein